MQLAYHGLPGLAGTRKLATWMTMLLMLAVLAACGGGAATTSDEPVAIAECNPNDSKTFAACGTVLVALTDADGDFLNYTVDVLSLKLETADGRIVETMPATTRINFTDYVDLTELVAVASIPPAIYVSGTISLDYAEAEVFVEANGDAMAAVVIDIDGIPLTQTELKIVFSDSDRLNITRGRAFLLQLDFDLLLLVIAKDLQVYRVTNEFSLHDFIQIDTLPFDRDKAVTGNVVAVDCQQHVAGFENASC